MRNFEQVLKLARGEFFMWASDDDLWEPGFVSTLASVLQADPSLVLAAAEAQYMLRDRTKLPFFAEGTAWYAGQKDMSQLERLLQVARHNYGNLMYGMYRREALLIGPAETVLTRVNFINEIPLFVHVAAQASIVVVPRILMYKTASLPTYVQAAWEYGVTPREGALPQAEDSDLSNVVPDLPRRWDTVRFQARLRLRRATKVIGTPLRVFAYHRAALADILRAVWRIDAALHVRLVASVAFVYEIWRHLLKIMIWRTQQSLE